MRTMRTALMLALLLLTVSLQIPISKAAAEQPPVNADARVRYFYESLLPYGNWTWHEQYGWCWYPYNMPVDWRPYSDGYWAYTDYGWTWVSDLPWGWACFHYGRWFYDDSYGWLWWPDTEWAPSWVVWRTGGDWIGWAPCPPEAVWREGFGLTFSVGVFDDFFPSRSFCFVRRRHFIDRDVHQWIEMRARNVTIFDETRVSRDNLRFESNHIVNRLPVHKELEGEIGHPIPRLKLANAESPERSRADDKEVRLFRPEALGRAIVTGAAQERSEKIGSQHRVSPEAPAMQVPPEIENRHAAEMRALEQSQVDRQRKLELQQAQEIKSASEERDRRQLMQRHQIERQSQQELMDQERQVIKHWQGREDRIYTAPAAPPQRRFNLQQQLVPDGNTGENSEDQGKGIGWAGAGDGSRGRGEGRRR